jgi:hypothetical protein
MAEMITLPIDCLQQHLPQPIPRGEDLQHRLLGNDVPLLVESDAFVADDPDVDGAGAALSRASNNSR